MWLFPSCIPLLVGTGNAILDQPVTPVLYISADIIYYSVCGQTSQIAYFSFCFVCLFLRQHFLV